jgi:hypothetical protein
MIYTTIKNDIGLAKWKNTHEPTSLILNRLTYLIADKFMFTD